MSYGSAGLRYRRAGPTGCCATSSMKCCGRISLLGGEQRGPAAAVFHGDFVIAGQILARVVHEFDRATGDVGDLRPRRRDKLDRRIVVFGHAMTGDERVDNHQADIVRPDRCNDVVDDRACDDAASPGLFGDNDFRLAAGVEEKPALDFGRVYSVVQRCSGNAPLQFLERVFSVPYPDC